MDFYSDVTAAVSPQISQMEAQSKGHSARNSAVFCTCLSVTLGIIKNMKLIPGKFNFTSSYCILISKIINSRELMFCHISKAKGRTAPGQQYDFFGFILVIKINLDLSSLLHVVRY